MQSAAGGIPWWHTWRESHQEMRGKRERGRGGRLCFCNKTTQEKRTVFLFSPSLALALSLSLPLPLPCPVGPSPSVVRVRARLLDERFMVARTSGSTVTILGDVWRCCRRRRGGLSSSLLIDLRFTDKKGAGRASEGGQRTRLVRQPRARALPKKSLTDNGSCTQIMAEDEEGRGKRDAKGQKRS